MTHLDTLLAQALALVSEDKRGELADIIEQIIAQAREDLAETAYENGYAKAVEDAIADEAVPQKVYVLATGPHLWEIQGMYATREALEDANG